MLKFTKKRVVSLVLVVAMLLGSIPADTFKLFSWAADVQADEPSVVGKFVQVTTTFGTAFKNEEDIGNFYAGIGVGFADYPELLVISSVVKKGSATYYQLRAAKGYYWPVNENKDVGDGWYLESTKVKFVDPKNTVVDAEGKPLSSVQMGKYEKPVLTAKSPLEGEQITYQWQIEYATDKWVNIYGANGMTVKLSYGMVARLMNADGKVNVRVKSSNGTMDAYSAAIPVQVTNSAAAASAYSMANPSVANNGVMAAAEGDVPTINNTVTVTIKFVYGANPTRLVADSIENTIQKGTAYSYPNFKLPEMEGFSAYYEDDTENPLTVVDIELEEVNEDVTITFKYWPAKVNYTVIYYWQNANDDKYTEHERVVLTDFTGNLTTVEDKEYNGFYQLLYENVPIASDGSTVIEVYYDRYYYLMLFDLDGGYGVQPVYARYGATLPTLTPSKAGCDFMGWDSDADHDNDVDKSFPTTMPLNGANYTAIWAFQKDKVDVHVVIWGENPNNEQYSYFKSETIQVAPGTEINYKNSILTCTQIEHTHNDGCGYNCKKEEHSHAECLINCSHVHTLACYGNPKTTNGVTNNDLQAIGDIGNDPESGYVYTINTNLSFTTYYYFYYNGKWYAAASSMIEGQQIGNDGEYSKGIQTWTAKKYKAKMVSCTHQVHNDSCYTCGKTAHDHSDSCGYACGKTYHRHSVANGCYASDNFMDAKLWTLVNSDTVTVAPDGSTIINVYYDRTEFTMTFKKQGSNGQLLGTITDKWGASIMSRFESISKANTFFWSLKQNGGEPWTSFVEIMPQENRTYYADPQSGNTQVTAKYWVQKVDGTGYEVVYTVSFKGSSTLSVTKEEFVEIEGFTFNESKSTDIGDYYNGANFYYDRKSYNLQFHDNGETGILKDLTKSVKYEGSLAAYSNIKLDDSDAPEKYEPGSVKFAGWYTNPEGEGDPFDFANTKMPASNVILYAKWVPVTHTVTFYTDKQYVGTDTIYTDGTGKEYIYTVSHGSKIQDPLIPPNDPTKGKYIFNGWYYLDANGVEQRWHFEQTQVTRDVEVYAKWSSNTLMEYTIRFVYVDANGNEIAEIADPITGSALGGASKTFNAKGNDELKVGYQEGYFPLIDSHTIVLDLEDTSKNTFTFEYVKKDAVPYTVYYVTQTLKENDNGLGTIELNGKKYYIVAQTKNVEDNKKAIVTETYVPVAGYLPTSYQETLVINPDATAENPNRIIFEYSVDEKNSMYVVHYYFQSVDGTKYEEDKAYLFQSKAEIGSNVNAAILDIENFTYYANHPDALTEGTIKKGEVLELHVYYKRNTYSYKVQYLEEGTAKILMPQKIVAGILWDSYVTEDFVAIDNYTLTSDKKISIQIRKDTADPTVNIITFFYKENTVEIKYEVVGPIGCGEVTHESETVKVATGKAKGSKASESSNVYKFVGWYKDSSCKELITTDYEFIPTKGENELWVNNTTYYAKFEYNLTSLTINKVTTDKAGNVVDYKDLDKNQTFIFNIKGNGVDLDVTVHGNGSVTIDGLTVGATYTITEKTDWSWRYDCTGWTHGSASGEGNVATIELGLNGTITFTNERGNEQWLDGDSWCDNIFGQKAN